MVDLAGTVNSALSGVAMLHLRDSVLVRGYGELRSLDAIHLASALEIGADSMLTYDDRLAESAAAVGLSVLTPRG